MAVGFGGFPGQGEQVAVFEDNGAGFALLRWLRVPWSEYAAANGETRPAAGDLDGDGRADLVVALGRSAAGSVAVLRDPLAETRAWSWLRYPASTYDSSNGETWPSVGDLDGDGQAEVALGPGAGGGGDVALFADVTRTPRLLGWCRLAWTAYDAASGEVRPAIGDIDGDGAGELALGIGPYPSGGVVEVVRGPLSQAPSFTWMRVPWVAYAAEVGSTRPAVLRASR